MSNQPRTFVLYDDHIAANAVDAVCRLLPDLANPMVVRIEVYEPPRTLKQNRYYWAGIINPAAKELGYRPNKLHEILLSEYFGVDELVSPTGKRFTRPKRRTSNNPDGPMRKVEMIAYLEWCPTFLAEYGAVVDAKPAIAEAMRMAA